jgi:hypothetical protein
MFVQSKTDAFFTFYHFFFDDSFRNFIVYPMLFITPGFSLGDELGFPESLGNLEGSKKRSLDIRTGNNQIGVLPAAKLVRFLSHHKLTFIKILHKSSSSSRAFGFCCVNQNNEAIKLFGRSTCTFFTR